MNDSATCNDCGYRVTLTDGDWIAEDDTACCAGRGDPLADPAECLPHRPTFVRVDDFPTFRVIRYPVTAYNREEVTP